MKTNDIKKGDWVILRNGWKARIEDNKRGQTRLATVHGLYTEMGSVYSHDILLYCESEPVVDPNGTAHVTPGTEARIVEHTKVQKELRKTVGRFS